MCRVDGTSVDGDDDEHKWQMESSDSQDDDGRDVRGVERNEESEWHER